MKIGQAYVVHLHNGRILNDVIYRGDDGHGSHCFEITEGFDRIIHPRELKQVEEMF